MELRDRPRLHARDHLPGGADPIAFPATGLTSGGPGLLDTILGKGVTALWKLDETSGVVAHDSSGNGYDMTVPGGFAAPTWGQAALEPGTPSALFQKAATHTKFKTTAIGAPASGDFSAGIWFKRPDNLQQAIMGGGDPFGLNTGWEILIGAFNEGLFNRAKIAVGNGSTDIALEGDNPLVTDGSLSYLIGFSRVSGVWYLYVDGLQQSSTISTVMSGGTSDIWIGYDDSNAHGCDGDASWAFFKGDGAFTAGDWLDLITALNPDAADGAVLSADSATGKTKFRDLVGTGGVTVTVNPDDITIDGSGVTGTVTIYKNGA